MRGLLAVIGFFVVVGWLVSTFSPTSHDNPPAGRPSQPAPSAQPADSPSFTPKPTKIELVAFHVLLKAYGKNEVAADKVYKGRYIRVAGKINKIAKDITDDPYITMGGDFKSVNCYFTDTHADEIAELSKGEPIVFEGQVSGYMVGDVILRHCSIIGEAQLAIDHPEAAKEFAAAKKKRRRAADDDE